ncbi:hypothetical protein PYCC9005_004582 [Savitreella phatthalungensis]
MSYIFGKSRLCDGSNVSSSRSYVNTELRRRGYLTDDEPLKFNSADAPAVINLLHDFLLKTAADEADVERLTAKARQLSSENERHRSERHKLEAKLRDADRDVSAARGELQQAKSAHQTTTVEARQLREALTRASAAVSHIKVQMSHDLRRRDVQILRLKEQICDVPGKQRSASGGLVSSYRYVPSRSTSDATDPYVDAEGHAQFIRAVDRQRESAMLKIVHENDELRDLLQATLASLDSLVKFDGEDSAMLSSVARSVTVLEAQLRVRLTALREILDTPGFVPIEEVEFREEKIRQLVTRLSETEAECSAAQHVLRGLRQTTAATMAGAGTAVLHDAMQSRLNAKVQLAAVSPIDAAQQQASCASAPMEPLRSLSTDVSASLPSSPLRERTGFGKSRSMTQESTLPL